MADFGMHVGLVFATFRPLTSKNMRTGKNVKICTAPRRDAHFQGLMGVQHLQKTTRSRKMDTYFVREGFGSQLGGILDDLGLQKWPKTGATTMSKMRPKNYASK